MEKGQKLPSIPSFLAVENFVKHRRNTFPQLNTGPSRQANGWRAVKHPSYLLHSPLNFWCSKISFSHHFSSAFSLQLELRAWGLKTSSTEGYWSVMRRSSIRWFVCILTYRRPTRNLQRKSTRLQQRPRNTPPRRTSTYINVTAQSFHISPKPGLASQ